jgi:hypothetical protein
VVKEG